jgi:hypothetical protein
VSEGRERKILGDSWKCSLEELVRRAGFGTMIYFLSIDIVYILLFEG